MAVRYMSWTQNYQSDVKNSLIHIAVLFYLTDSKA